MTVSALLDRLVELGISIRLQGDDLEVLAPRGVLTLEMQKELRARKTEIMRALRAAGTQPYRYQRVNATIGGQCGITYGKAAPRP